MDHMIMNQGRCSGASMVYAHPAGQAWRSQRQCNGMVFEVGASPKTPRPPRPTLVSTNFCEFLKAPPGPLLCPPHRNEHERLAAFAAYQSVLWMLADE